MPVGADKGKQ